MRIIAGRWKGRALIAPPGLATRPTSDRARQAIFDQLWHAPWAGRAVVENAVVLDGFAGTGAMGLEALSRGAAQVFFMEQDRAALTTLRANIAACKAGDACRVIVGDVTAPPQAATPCNLVFLDPPYGKGLVPRALGALQAKGWIAPGALIIAETGRDEAAVMLPGFEVVSTRDHGAARLSALRAAAHCEDAAS
ncbi:MAG: 16S rRNA (guanine(966)-N(2))-methyltransferase RsmD [Roseomonas sp.]|nr:16S rRNA (guanine(966)-N(2))-methyltransferase RsmD [Roseomonas sp.]MCA3430450.1 16S rRNA (guanine(966)-N(2))-methyltransferase RsmD [Roseomonas sp.]MCA3433853.1 16S rRNA (guanine(966)-N(2))-methyltransferase RsmD [Roseomonas sp.]